MTCVNRTHRLVVVLLLLQLLHQDGPLLVFTPLVLEPHPDDPGAEAGHLHQLLLHEGVGPRVGVVAGPQRVQLLLVQHRPDARGLLRRLVHVVSMGGMPDRHRLWECYLYLNSVLTCVLLKLSICLNLV